MVITRKEAQNLLKGGGQRVRQQATAEIFDRKGAVRERQTGAGMRTKVHQLLDPRLDVTSTQRAVGNYYGTLYEKAMAGEGQEFLREYVDSSSKGGGSFSEAQLQRVRMLTCASKALLQADPFTYPVGTPRGSYIFGKHHKIKALAMAQAVCVQQRTLSEIAITNGWVRIPIENGKWGRPKVPDRQRKALAAALRTTLDAIATAWEEGSYRVPYAQLTVEVE